MDATGVKSPPPSQFVAVASMANFDSGAIDRKLLAPRARPNVATTDKGGRESTLSFRNDIDRIRRLISRGSEINRASHHSPLPSPHLLFLFPSTFSFYPSAPRYLYVYGYIGAVHTVNDSSNSAAGYILRRPPLSITSTIMVTRGAMWAPICACASNSEAEVRQDGSIYNFHTGDIIGFQAVAPFLVSLFSRSLVF